MHREKDIMSKLSGKHPALLSIYITKRCVDLCSILLFTWISCPKTWQATSAFDFSAWKYKRGVKHVAASVLAQFWTYCTLLPMSDRIGVNWRSWQTMKTGKLSVKQGCNGLSKYTERLKVKLSLKKPKLEFLQAWQSLHCSLFYFKQQPSRTQPLSHIAKSI